MQPLAFTTFAVCLAAILPVQGADQGVQLTQLQDRIRVEVDGKLFTEYYFANVPRPFCYPIKGPGEVEMTRNYPMKDVPDEDRDHKHHRSLWYSHGAVNGHDFWAETDKAGMIVHDRFLLVESGSKVGTIRAVNKWVAADGTLVCTDEQVLRFYSGGGKADRMLDFDITLKPANGDLVLGDTKEGTMGIRIAETMRLKGKVGKGHILNSEGVKDDATWGKRAEWCGYYGPVDGKTVGIAIFDHPGNPRHPTWWHVRDYGLFAANPFGKHDFEKLPDKAAGDLKVPAGESVTFRYRFIFHEGDTQSANLPAKFKQYATAGQN